MKNIKRTLHAIGEKIAKNQELTYDDILFVNKLHKQNNKNNKFVRVEKVQLNDNESLYDFTWAMYEAVEKDRALLGDGSIDIYLQGIYDDYVIIQDFNTGKFFKANWSRDENGLFSFSNVEEVVQVYQSVDTVEKGDFLQEIVKIDISKKANYDFLNPLPRI